MNQLYVNVNFYAELTWLKQNYTAVIGVRLTALNDKYQVQVFLNVKSWIKYKRFESLNLVKNFQFGVLQRIY